MGDLNNVVATGRLVRQPILRNTTTGKVMATFTIASNHRFKDAAGTQHEEVAFLACVAFGGWAKSLAHRDKGEMLMVAGRLRTETWDDNGEKRSQLGLVCDSVRFFSGLRLPPDEAVEPLSKPTGSAALENHADVPF